MTSKRKDLNLCDKLKVLEAVRNRKTQTEIAKEFKISQSQVSNIKKNAHKIEEEWRNNGSLDRKRKRKSNFDEIDQAVLEWFHAKRTKGALINGAMIMQKTEEIAKSLENADNFSSSKGWLYRLQQRNNLKFKTLHGESGSVDEAVCDQWIKETLEPILIAYDQKDVFNCDETSLLFRALPNGTLAKKKNETIQGLKTSKERLTVLFCANATDEDKIEPLVIGKSKLPICLKNVKKYPVSYDYSINSWMTRSIFIKWLTNLDRSMKKQNRKIVLFMDNVASHKVEDSVRLSNVKVEFLPANTTAKIQPLDQGIIRSFKAGYKRQIINELLKMFDLDVESDSDRFSCLSKRINLLTAMHFCKKAWNDVSPAVIKNSFRKVRFTTKPSEENDSWDTETLELLPEDCDKLQMTQEELLVFIEFEEAEETEKDELTSCSQNFHGHTEEDDNDDDVVDPPPSLCEVQQSLAVIRSSFENRGGDYNVLYNLEKEIQKCSQNTMNKQSIIMDFFKK